MTENTNEDRKTRRVRKEIQAIVMNLKYVFPFVSILLDNLNKTNTILGISDENFYDK